MDINRTLYANDCLNTLKNEYALPDNCVDLIYLDPPFNSNQYYNLPFEKNLLKDIRPVEAFKDTWSWGENETELMEKLKFGSTASRNLAQLIKIVKAITLESNGANSLSAYLINLAVRLIPIKRVLKDTGSIYLHCDPTASHYLKLLMDTIFGKRNFRNEIIWCYAGGGTKI